MAKATFSCATCGASVTVEGRNRADADRFAAYREQQGALCSDCQAKAFAAENAAAADRAQAAGLPALTGTEKQAAWAATLREKALPSIDAALAHAEEQLAEILADKQATERELADARSDIELIRIGCRMLRERTAASDWIDTRGTAVPYLLSRMRPALEAERARLAAQPSSPEESAQEQAAQDEALLKPVAPISTHVAEISQPAPDELRVTFPQRLDEVRDAMHALGYTWAGQHWSKRMSFQTGDPVDRMAEAASHLLASGVMVRLHNTEARQRAIAGAYTAEQRRWVSLATTGKYAGWFLIAWPRSDDLYAPARRLLGSRYADGHVFVPPGSAEEVLDFADTYGFSLSPGAQAAADKRRAELAAGVVVTPKQPDSPAPVRESDSLKPQRLDVPDHTEVADELRDHD